MAQKAFSGLHSLQEALDSFHTQVAEQIKRVELGIPEDAALPDGPPCEFTVQTEEIRQLSEACKLLTSEVPFGLTRFPVLFKSAYISDALQGIYDQFGLSFRWLYSQYRACDSAMVLGVKKELKQNLLDFIHFNKCEHPELNDYLNHLRTNEATSQWNFIGKPLAYGEFVYIMLMPRELIGHPSGGFYIKTWDFLTEGV